MARKAPVPKPDAELAEKMLAVLQAQRALGGEAYPLTLQRLVELTDPQAAPELVLKAVGKKPFKDRVIVAHKKSNTASPIALNEDVELFAGSPLLLEFALEKLCSPDNPTCAPGKLKGQVDAKLKKPLEEAAMRHISENTLPARVGHQLQKNKPVLFLHRLPPPPPPAPPKKKEEVLANNLLHVLEAQRQLGPGAYPPLLSRLKELTDPAAPPALLTKALAHPSLKSKITLVGLIDVKKPVVLLGDQAQLLSSGWMLEFLMGAKRQANEHAFAVEALLPKKSPLLPALLETVHHQIETNTLPPTVGWMWIAGKKQLFLLEDVHSNRSAPPAAPSISHESHETHKTHESHETHKTHETHETHPTPETPEPPSDFAPRFDDAFTHFNRQNGGINFVSLVEMRKALHMPADVFNAELRKLRVAGRYTLSGAEGRHGLGADEQAAGIVEDGSLLLYVSRKNP